MNCILNSDQVRWRKCHPIPHMHKQTRSDGFLSCCQLMSHLGPLTEALGFGAGWNPCIIGHQSSWSNSDSSSVPDVEGKGKRPPTFQNCDSFQTHPYFTYTPTNPHTYSIHVHIKARFDPPITVELHQCTPAIGPIIMYTSKSNPIFSPAQVIGVPTLL